MDTMQTSTPDPILPQSEAFSPAESPSRRWFLWSAIVLALLALGAAIGIFSAKFLNQSPSQSQLSSTPTPAQSPTPTPTPDLTVNWRTYISTKYGFSFKYPDLDSTCCNISGPIIGKPEKVVVLADLSTARMGTDKPFDGLGVFIDTSEIDLNNKEGFASYIYGQKSSLIENYREFLGQEPTNLEGKSIAIGGVVGTVLKGYAWWGEEMIYMPLPHSQKVLVLVKTESSRGSFDRTFNLILSTFHFLK